jgi:hypothetical protein
MSLPFIDVPIGRVIAETGHPQDYLCGLNSGYWQMTMDLASEEKTAYFISEGKKHFKRMPMGIKKAMPAFTQMIIVLEKNWKRQYQSDMPKYINIVIDIMRKLIKGEP